MQGFKNLQKIILLKSQSTDFPTCDTNWFLKSIFTYQFLEILLSQKNVKKKQNYTKMKILKKFQHFICPLFHIVQMNFQIILTTLQNINMFELTLLNLKVVYIHL